MSAIQQDDRLTAYLKKKGYTFAEWERMAQYLTEEEARQLYEAVEVDDGRFKPPQNPTSHQKLFLDLDNEREVFYGGAAGGGKSSALLMAALEYVHIKGYAALLLRRTYADLSKPGALIDRAHEWLKGSDAKWNEQKKTWTFPSGATLSFGYLDNENDKYQYQGAEFQFIGFDELTQFTESQYLYLFSRLRRLMASDIPIRMRAASNPGGIGGRWVYDRFIPEGFMPEMAQKQRVFWNEGVDEEGKPFKRAFVPARLSDNPYLDRDEYEQSLLELDAVTRAQLLQGDWQIQERGDILYMYSDAHVCITWSQFERVFGVRHIPLHWLLGVYQDWGTTPTHPCVTTWFATAPESVDYINKDLVGSVFVYRGVVLDTCTARDVCEKMLELMKPHGELARLTRRKMSHEASSERLEYQKQHLAMQAWETGKNLGIEQLKGAFMLRNTDRPHPFKPSLCGRPLLYFIVDDKQEYYAKDDAGLVRHRAEAVAYKWKELKSGEPAMKLEPHALFNDAMDTLRAAAYDYFPKSLLLTYDEKVERVKPQKYRYEEMLKESPYEHGLTAAQEMTYLLQDELARKKVKSKVQYFDDNYNPVDEPENIRF